MNVGHVTGLSIYTSIRCRGMFSTDPFRGWPPVEKKICFRVRGGVGIEVCRTKAVLLQGEAYPLWYVLDVHQMSLHELTATLGVCPVPCVVVGREIVTPVCTRQLFPAGVTLPHRSCEQNFEVLARSFLKS